MSDATCGHCGTAIRERSTLVEQAGQAYCCPNCARAVGDPAFTPGGGGVCAHCATIIVDETTVAEQDGMLFCCKNCAAAMTAADDPTAPTY